MSVLFLGEASFSFTCALRKGGFFRAFGRVVASTPWSREETFRVFDGAEKNIDCLVDECEVMFGVGKGESRCEAIQPLKKMRRIWRFPQSRLIWLCFSFLHLLLRSVARSVRVDCFWKNQRRL